MKNTVAFNDGKDIIIGNKLVNIFRLVVIKYLLKFASAAKFRITLL